MNARERAAEIAAPVVIIAICAIAATGLIGVRHSQFDPIGAAMIPALVIGITVALCLARIFMVAAGRPGAGSPEEEVSPVGADAIVRVGAVAALTLAYTYALAELRVRFDVATAIWLCAFIFAVDRKIFARHLWLVPFVIAFAVVLRVMFTRWLVIDLP